LENLWKEADEFNDVIQIEDIELGMQMTRFRLFNPKLLKI